MKNIRCGIFVEKSQHPCSEAKFCTFLTNLRLGKYLDNIAIYCTILKYQVNIVCIEREK